MPWNLANILTVTRLVLLPLIVLFLYLPFVWAAWVSLGIYVFGSLTDYLDGYVARKYGQESDFGRLMDPVSDKIFVMTILLMLVAVDRITGGWVLGVVIIMVREFLVSGLREFLGGRAESLPVTPLAKWKTAVQMLAIGLLIIQPASWIAGTLGHVLLISASLLTAYTGWQYLQKGLSVISRSK